MKFRIEDTVNDVDVMRFPPLDAKVGGTMLQLLRKLKEVRLPEGLTAVGEAWFTESKVRKIVVPPSVREICACAFKDSRDLRSVEFIEGSILGSIGHKAFYGSGLM